jgi:hypothetical protein
MIQRFRRTGDIFLYTSDYDNTGVDLSEACVDGKKDCLWLRSLQLHADMLRKRVRGLKNLYIYSIISSTCSGNLR